jgi:hypothetical protein
MATLVYLRAISLGVALSVATLALIAVAVMLGADFLISALLYFGAPSIYLLTSVVPAGLVYRLVPDGGGPAFVLLSLVGVFLQLAIIYGWLIYRFKLRGRS